MSEDENYRQGVMSWLGEAADDLTDDQIDAVEAEFRAIEQRYPDRQDQEQEREAARTATVQWLLGETTADEARGQLLRARVAQDAAMAAALQVGRLLVRSGTDEETAGAAVGVARATLRKALGK